MSWKCPICTFATNAPESAACQMCQTPRQGAAQQGGAQPEQKQQQGGWKCATCTFPNNAPNAPKCQMCQSPRAAAVEAAKQQEVFVRKNKFNASRVQVGSDSQWTREDELDDEKLFDIADDPQIPFTAFFDVMEEHPECGDKVVKIPATKTLYETLRSMDPEIIAEPGRSKMLCCTTTVLQGQIGKATLYGETYFFPPGNYWWLGLGVDFQGTVDIEDAQHAGSTVTWKDITYINVAECNCAVVQVDRKQLILGPGRYVLRNPAQLFGRVNIQSLKNKHQITQQTEVPGVVQRGQDPRDVEDKLQDVKLAAGEIEKCGAVTFVRANPGFCYVVQNVLGQLRTGIGMTVCRSGEIFLCFIDRQNYSRTTRTFYLESRDRQEVRVRVQLKWRLENAKLWIQRKGASEDIFDAIEEITESLMRDAIASHTYEEAAQAASEGFDSMEQVVADPLRMECRQLGGKLIGFEIRSLRFPLLERRNTARAEQETVMSEAILKEKRELQVAQANYLRDDANLLYVQREEKAKIQHLTKMQVLRDQEELARMEARARLEIAKQNYEIEKTITTLNALKTQQILELDQVELKARSNITQELIHVTGKADEVICVEQAKADSVRMEAGAQADAKIQMAEADAKAADHIGSAYQDNGPYLELVMARMNAELQEERATEVALAMESREGELIMLPKDIQDEMTEIAVVGPAKKARG